MPGCGCETTHTHTHTHAHPTNDWLRVLWGGGLQMMALWGSFFVALKTWVMVFDDVADENSSSIRGIVSFFRFASIPFNHVDLFFGRVFERHSILTKL